MRPGDDKTDDELLQMVLAADEESFAAGCDPKQRSLDVPHRVLTKLGYYEYVEFGAGSPPVRERICAIHRSLYRPKDFAVGGIHGGFFMFRDVYCRIDVPIAFGQFRFEPLDLTDLSLKQKKWLLSQPSCRDRFFEQFAYVFDFAGCIHYFDGYERPPKPALHFFDLAGFQLQSAAATANSAFDPRGSIQSALLGAELALKGGLVAAGYRPENLKKEFGHDREKAARALVEKYTDFEIDKVLDEFASMPRFVENRYSSSQPGRIETGEIVMGAQLVAGEVIRTVSKFTIKLSVE